MMTNNQAGVTDSEIDTIVSQISPDALDNEISSVFEEKGLGELLVFKYPSNVSKIEEKYPIIYN